MSSAIGFKLQDDDDDDSQVQMRQIDIEPTAEIAEVDDHPFNALTESDVLDILRLAQRASLLYDLLAKEEFLPDTRVAIIKSAARGWFKSDAG